ncbi:MULTISPECIES: coiled-coil domain-containing protein [unclassified Micromonospora]|uniref:coiled-coil domain-containing protein n=1 Tax=unclassified Micromonospora TaxID=2617518 RepID=UPI003A87DA9B
MTAPLRRRIPTTAALAAVAALLAGFVVVSPAAAQDPDDEGAPPLLSEVLESTGRGFVEAKAAVDESRKRQLKLNLELEKVEERISALTPQIGQVASNSYRLGRITPVMVLLNSADPDELLERAEGLDMIAMHDNKRIRELNEAREQAARAVAAIDAEVAREEQQLEAMARQKEEAEKALQLVGAVATNGFVSATSPVAAQAPRNSDGSWPSQSCSLDDPTTSGCITPRTMHALNEAKKAGFTRFVSCFRPGGPFEHPKGRACDFSAQQQGFGGDAFGDDRLYGNNLTAFLVRNADKLGILYVIWYRQFWSPTTGWSSYSGANGDPNSDHTNHVHLSLL